MDLQFDDLSETARRIHDLRSDIGYLTLCEVVDRQNDRTLVRVDFNNAQLGGYLRDDRPPLTRAERARLPADEEEDERELDEEDQEASEEEDEDGGMRLADLGVPDTTLPSLADLARAAMRWLRHSVAGLMLGETERDFKIRVFSAKGHKTIHARRFSVRDLDRERAAKTAAPVPAPISAALLPTVAPLRPEAARSEALPEARAWRALSEGYVNLIALVQPSYAHLATLQNAALSNQQAQIQQLQSGLETVTGELVKLRVGLAEVGQVEQRDAEQAKLTDSLGKSLIAEAGSVGRAFFTSKFGASAELVKVADLVASSPELSSALQDPEVLALLGEAEVRAEFGNALKLAVATRKEAKAAAQRLAAASPPAPAPPSPSSSGTPSAT